jgi:hypothetical protein
MIDDDFRERGDPRDKHKIQFVRVRRPRKHIEMSLESYVWAFFSKTRGAETRGFWVSGLRCR